MIKILLGDNMEFDLKSNGIDGKKADLIYADMIYENMDFSWVSYYWEFLNEGGVFMVQTDHHSVFEMGVLLKSFPGSHFVNHVVWKCEWGNYPKDRFNPCFDNIIIVSKGRHKQFDPTDIQVPKVTASSRGLNKSGRMTKPATAFISDITLTTQSKERIRKDDGHLIRWQKPEGLLKRLFSPFIEDGDFILDPFMGSGTSGVVADNLNCHYVGIELEIEPFILSRERLRKEGIIVYSLDI